MSAAEMEEVKRFFRFGFGFGRRGAGDPGPEVRAWMLLALRANPDPAIPRPKGDPLVSLKTELLNALSQNARGSREIHGFILGLVDDPEFVVRRAAAEALDRLGPIYPEAIGQIGHLIEKGRSPAALLRLLTRYRALPPEIDALVRELAAGRVPTPWTADGVMSDELARRYRLPQGRSGLESQAKALLESVTQRTRDARPNNPAG